MMARRMSSLVGVLLLIFSLVPAVSGASVDIAPRYDVLLILRVAPFAGDGRAAEAEEEAGDLFRTLHPRLLDLQASGAVEDFTWLPDAHAIRVQGATAETLDALRGLDGVLEVQPATARILSCARRAVAGFAASEEMRRHINLSAVPAASEATNPTIFVNLRYGYIFGTTDPHVPVTVTIKSASGVAKGTRFTVSLHDGSYSSYDLSLCTNLIPGDVVEVRAGASRVASTTVVPITAEINPTADTVFGNTAASRSVDVRLLQEQNSCSAVETIRTVTSNVSGAYTANFAGAVDIKRYARAEIWVYDRNRNATLLPISAPHIEVSMYGGVDVTLRPDRTITATLRSGSTVIATETEMTDHWGDASFSFSPRPAPGNTIQVTDGGMTIIYQMVPFSLTQVNLGANQFTLQTAGNRRVRVSTRTLSSRFCADDFDCRVVTSDGAGNVNVNLGSSLDLGRGDEISANIYDAEGNWQEGERHPGYVEVARQDKSVSGFWEQIKANLTILLRDSGGAVKASKTTTSAEADGSFFTTFSASNIAVGDRFEVGNGVLTYTVPVVNLTVFANEVTDFVSGQAPNNGPLLVQTLLGCWQGNASGMNYNARLKTATNADVDLKAGDSVSTFYTDSNGHQNVVDTHVPQINAIIGTGNVNGYIREASTPLTVTLRSQGGSIKATQVVTSTTSDFYVVNLGVNVAVSDKIEVQPRGGSMFSLTVPNLTVLLDPPGNRVYGQTLPHTPVLVSLSQGFSFLGSDSTTSDGAGNYSVSFAGKLTFDCLPIQVGTCSRAMASFFTPDGHGISRQSAPPPDVTPDAYEQDDSKATAKAYTGGLQHRTFDTETFVDQDWVKFTVGAADVGKLYIIETLNNGPLGDTILTLYDTDGFTELVTAGDYGGPLPAQIRWRFEAAGTYYVQITPGTFFGPGSSCGATYDLFISNRHVFMPLVHKNG
jgi:hypothetical protein